jgi:hypothetical protein
MGRLAAHLGVHSIHTASHLAAPPRITLNGGCIIQYILVTIFDAEGDMEAL